MIVDLCEILSAPGCDLILCVTSNAIVVHEFIVSINIYNTLETAQFGFSTIASRENNNYRANTVFYDTHYKLITDIVVVTLPDYQHAT